MASENITNPTIELRQVSARRIGVIESWRMRWRVGNRSPTPLKLASVRFPHGQFKSEEQKFNPELELAPGSDVEFEALVGCDNGPGLVTENAFVIFYVNYIDEPWRIFVRLRVVVNEKGEPFARTVLITTHKVGFTGVKF